MFESKSGTSNDSKTSSVSEAAGSKTLHKQSILAFGFGRSERY